MLMLMLVPCGSTEINLPLYLDLFTALCPYIHDLILMHTRDSGNADAGAGAMWLVIAGTDMSIGLPLHICLLPRVRSTRLFE